MEQLPGAGALLAMVPHEAVVLSVEGARRFVRGSQQAVPAALRFSITPLDELHATLHAFGYYESAGEAEASIEHIERLRGTLIEHPQVEFLGLKSALRDARLVRTGETIELEVKLTMHQTRYLMGLFSRALGAQK
jgi:hypothetical protein